MSYFTSMLCSRPIPVPSSAAAFMLSILIPLLLLSSHLHALTVSAPDPEIGDESPFNYDDRSDKGPKRWGKLKQEWRVCESGALQSPIDLLGQRVQIRRDLGKLRSDYKAAPAVLKNRGHDIKVEWKGDAGHVEIDGTYYKLLQGHWHTPSEHTFNGSRYNLELHLVHESSDNKTAVTAIVYKYGYPDPFLARLFRRINSDDQEEKELGIVNPGEIKSGSREYYRYIGSLTVPPCTEGVIWTVEKKVRTVSKEQVRLLREMVHDGFEANARPTQPLAGRSVWLYTP